MLIEFKIQIDNGVVTAVPVDSNLGNSAVADARAPQHQLPQAFVKGGSGPIDDTATGSPKKNAGGSGPVDDTATGTPFSGSPATVLVLGPIVIFGSGPGHTTSSSSPAQTSAGGSGPIDDTATGKPDDQADINENAAARNYKEAKVQNRRRKR